MAEKEKSGGSSADLQSPIQTDKKLTLEDILQNGEIQIRSGSIRSSNHYFIIMKNSNYINLNLTKIEKMDEDFVPISFDSIKPGEQQRLISNILENKNTKVLEAALRTLWLRDYEPFLSLTQLLLHMITLTNNTSAFECLFFSHSSEIEWNFADPDDNSIFHLVLAKFKLDVHLIEKLFQDKKIQLKPFTNKINQSNETLLSLACKKQLLPVIEVLIELGASILIQEPKNPEIWTLPTFSYIHLGVHHTEYVIYIELTNGMSYYSLIANPAEVYLKPSSEFTRFEKMSPRSKQEFTRNILKSPSSNLISLILENQKKETVDLFFAVEHASPTVLSKILKKTTVSFQTQKEMLSENNIIHIAIEMKKYDNLELLMKRCEKHAITTNLDAKNKQGETPLDLAILLQYHIALSIIFNERNDFMAKQWLTEVERAISNDNIEILKALMNYFNVDYHGQFMYEQTDNQGFSILHIAVKKFKSEEAFYIILNKYKSQSAIKKQNLIDCKITSQLPNFKGQTPLLLSLIDKKYLATEKLLEAGAANLNEGEHCYFHYLIKFCQEEEELKELEKLLNIDLEPKQFSQCTKPSKVKIWEVTDNDSNTLLHYSVKIHNSIVIDLLDKITPFTDLLKLDSQGNSLLHTAATLPQHPIVINCIIDILKKYHSHEQNSELLDLQNENDGCTSLMLAVKSNHFKFVESLIKEGASILLVNHEGDSILHIAAKLGRENIFKLILDIVDDCKRDRTDNLKILHQQNSEGYSPIQCAVVYAKIQIVKLFRERHSLPYIDHKTGNSLLHLVVLKSKDLQVHHTLIAELLTDRSLLDIKDKHGRTPLLLSTIMHKVDIVNIFLQYQPDLLAIDSQGFSLLHNAVISYDKKTFIMILNAIKSDKNSKQILNFEEKEQKKTVFHYSIEKNNKEATEEILKLGLSLESEDIEGNTYLHAASKSPGTVDILKLILKHTKSSSKNISILLKKQNKEKLTPLLYAICNQNYGACQVLIDENANLFYQTVNGPAFHKVINKSPLTVCEHKSDYCIGYSLSYNGYPYCVLSQLTNLRNAKLVLNNTIKVIEKLNDDLVKTFVRCEQVHPLQALLRQVDFVKLSQHRKKSSLYILAAQFGSLPVILFLIKEYFTLTDFEFDHGNILHAALSNPEITIMKELCNHVQRLDCHEKVGEILSTKQENGIYPLELCIQEGKIETFEYLLISKFQLEINFCDCKGTTIIHHILKSKRVSETRKQFLDTLATTIQDREDKKPKSTYINNTPLEDCHMQGSGETPLHLCASKYPDCISTILQFNPSPIEEDSSGNTALHLSVKSANINCTTEIINAYKNSISEITNKTNNKKQTPLHIAVEISNLEIVELLLHNNSKLYAVDDESRTVLHYAVQISESSESEKMVQFLIKHETNNPKPNQSLSTSQDTKGYTPLHSAIECSNLKSMNVLLQYNFDFNTSDRDGNSILHLAILLCKSTTMVKSILEGYYKDTAVTIQASNEDEFINLKNNQGKTALILTVEKNNVDALNEILKYLPLLYLTDNDDNSCLHKAVESANELRCLGELLEIIPKIYPDEMKSYLSAINANGLSPLHHAIKNQNHRAAEKLRDHGANIAIQLPNGELTLCNEKGISFEILSRSPSFGFKTLGNVFTDYNDYFVCYDIVDNRTTYHIASLLPCLKSTAISTDLSTITSVTKRTLEMICSCHCIEPLIYAIKVKWIDFSKDESEDAKLWEVLCGDISDEVTDYLLTEYPDKMNSSQMFKSLESASKSQRKDRVTSFLKRNPFFGKQDLFINEEINSKMILIIKNSLEYSTDNDNTDILNILLEHGACFNHLYEKNDTLLHMIIQKKRPVTFLTSILEKIRQLQSIDSEKLIEGIPMINHQNNEGKTPLHMCIEIGDVELLEKLLEYQPELTLTDASINNIFHCVAKLGTESIAKIIFDHLQSPFPNGFPDTFFEKNQDGCTPLHLATAFGNESICNKLLEKGADIYATDTLEQTTLHHTLKNKNEDNRLAILNLIFNQQHSEIKADFVKRQDTNGFSALQIAVKLQYTAEVDLILRADPTAVYLTDNELQTPLHLAVVPTSSDSTVVTPPSNEIFDQILNSIVKPEVCTLDAHHSNGRLICHQDTNCKTALHISIASKYDYATYQLLKAHACLDLTDANEDTILHEAVKHPEASTVIECILQQIKQRNMNIQDFLTKTNRQGLRPLHLAIIHKNLSSVRLLSPDTTLSFENSSGKITLCDNIGGLNLKFLEDDNNKRYYTGYSFQLSRNTKSYWVYTDLPDFNKSVFDESCNFIRLKKFDNGSFLEVLVKCKSHEPLSSLIRRKKLALTDKIRDGLKFVQFSAEFSSPQVMEYILEIHDRTVFESIDKGPSLIECAVLNSNTDTLKLILTTLITFQEKYESQQAAISECLISSVKKSLDNESIALEILLRHRGCLSYLYGNDKGTLLHLVTLRMKGKDSNYAELILNVAKDLQIKIKSDFGEFSFINFPDSAGKTALYLAISKNRIDLLKVLLKFNPDLSIHNELIDTVLHYAVRNKSINFVRALLEVINACLNPEKYLEARNTEGLTPVQLSVSHSNAAITKSLLDSNVEFYVRDEKTNETLLHRSMQMTDNSSIRKTIIEEILKHEKEFLKLGKHKITSLKDRNNNTPLHQAVLRQQSDTIDILLSADPSVVLIPGDNNRTLLHMAVFSQNLEIFDKIIEHIKKEFETLDDSSIDNIICKQDMDGKTPVHLSIESKNLYALEKLLPLSKSCLETTDKDQDTLIHYAVKVSEEKCDYLKAVLEAFKTGYPEDFQSHLYPCNADGFPPLQYVIELKKLPAALVLIENSVQLPYQDRENNVLLRSPKSQHSLRILYKTPKSSKDPPSEFWIGFRIKISSKVNWIATSLPVISPKESRTFHFDGKSSMTEIEPNMLNTNILKVILQSHSTDPFKSAVNSKLITQNIKFRDEPILHKYIGQYSTKEVIAFYIDWYKCVIFERTKEQSSLIEYTVSNSDISILRVLLEKLPQNYNQSIYPPQSDATQEVIEQYEIALCLKSALKLSSNNDNVKALELLLRFNARHDHTYDGQNTLLHLMVTQHKPREFIKSLLTRNSKIEKIPADPGTVRFIDAQNAQKETALHIALQSKQENTIKAILSFGPNLLIQNSDGNTPLHSSILLNDFAIVESILNLGKEQNQEIINTSNKQKCTPLHLSVDSGTFNITKLLLNSKADIYCQDLHNRTVLHHAIAIENVKGNLMLINELINFENNAFSSSKLCSMQDSDGNTPLNLAIKISNHEIVTRLLEFSSVLKVVNKLKQTPLHLAVLSSNNEVFQSILDAVLQIENISNEQLPTEESIINSQDSKGYTPLHLCIISDNPDALVKMLAINPYLETIDLDGNSILHDAVIKPNILKLLLPKLLECNFPHFYLRNKTGLPPLQFAIKHKMFESIDALTKVGIKLAFATDNGETLCDMIEELSLEIVEYKCEQEIYWVGYTYKYTKSDVWVLSELPKLKTAIQVDNSKPNIVRKLNKGLLVKVAECISPEPLDAAFRNEKLKFDNKLEGGFEITEIIAEKGTLHSIKYILKKNNSTLIEGKDNHLSMVESAVRNRNLEVLDLLLQSIDTYQPKSNPKTHPPNNFQTKRLQCLKNSLWLSIHNPTADAFSTLLSYDLSPLTCTNKGNETLLHLIIQNNKPTEFINLIFRAVDEKEKDSPHSTHIKDTRFIDHQAGSKSISALHLCIEMGELGNFNVLLTHHPDTFLTDSFQNTCLHIAAKKRALEFSKQIIGSVEKGRLKEILESVNHDKESPLHITVKVGNINVTSYLLEVGSISNTTNIHGYSILHHAVEITNTNEQFEITNTNEQFEMIELILNYQKMHKDINLTEIRDHTGSTPLHNAIISKNMSAVKQLINFSSALRIPDNQGNIPLHSAVIYVQNDIFNCVLDSILKLEVECIGWLEQRLTCMKQRDGKTPLHLSIENRNTHALQSLLQTKPCLDVCDTNGDTVLHCAVKNSSDDSTCLEIVLKELEERFCDDYSYYIYFLNSRKLTPLHYAIKSSNLNCIMMLLEHQVNLAFLDPCGDRTLLDGIDGFSLSFVKHNGEYWIGYKFTEARKLYWILTNLPNLNHTEIVEHDLLTTNISDFELLKLISQSKSTEPLDAALRNELLNVNTILNTEHMSQVIARHGTKQSLRCLLSRTKYGLFHRSDGKLSMIECAVSNPNIDALDYLLHSLPTFQQQQQQQQQPGGIASVPLSEESTQICSCLKNSLQLSVSNDSSEALISLLRFYPKIDCTNIDDNTLIHQMVIGNKPSQFIKEVLKVIHEIEASNSLYKDKQVINHSNIEKKTALHCCIEREQLSTLEVILQFNPGAFVVDENEETSLHYAVNSNELEFVQAIYQYAPCIKLLSAKNNVANTALHLAVKNANDGIVEYLLGCEPPFDSQNSHGSTVLHLAVVIENPTPRETIMNQLILHNASKGLNVTRIQDSELKSPLHLAVSKQYPDAVVSLLSADPGALHIRDNIEQAPLHLAIIPSCSTNNPPRLNSIFDSVLGAIEQQGKHENKVYCEGKHLLCFQDIRKRTAMHYAIEHNYQHAFKEILKTGSCLNIPDELGNILAHEAGNHYADVAFIEMLTEELGTRYPDILDCFNLEKYGK